MRLLPRLVAVALAVTLVPACSDDTEPRSTDAPSSSPSASRTTIAAESPAATPTASATVAPSTYRERVRVVTHDPSPDPAEIISLTPGPTTWASHPNGQVLLLYSLGDYPAAIGWQLLGRGGKVRADGAMQDYNGTMPRAWPVPAGFVVDPGSTGMHLIRSDGAATRLSRVRNPAPPAPGEVWFGDGQLLGAERTTVHDGRLPGCPAGSLTVDRSHRIWCTNRSMTRVSWSDDGGASWTRHRLAHSYFGFCVGSVHGWRPVLVDGNNVAVILVDAEFSLDRGRSWQTSHLPDNVWEGLTDDRCPMPSAMPQGRLVLGYFSMYVAADTSNTSFRPIRTPRGSYFDPSNSAEGILRAVPRRHDGELLVSYDAGTTWRPFVLRELLRHLRKRC